MEMSGTRRGVSPLAQEELPDAGRLYYQYGGEEKLAEWELYLPEFVVAMEVSG